jgi:DNA repair protein RadD
LILRDYQQRAICDLRATYATGKRAPCLVLPTGGGKTLIASEIIRAALTRSKRVLFLAHRTELLEQTVGKLERFGVTDVRLIQAARDTGSPIAPVTVASVQTLTRWQDRMPRADLVVFDECHHVVAKTWASIATHYAGAHLLGMTATPARSDGRPLGDIFDALVVGATVRELTDLGHLVPCRVFAPVAVLDTEQLALSPVEAYAQHGAGERAVIFCVTVDHARAVADEMTAAGVHTEIVHGNGRGRAEVLRRFAAGEIRAIANVHVLTEGWDDPGVAVCILARKPEHAGTMLQMVGRVLRPASGKTHATLIDLCGSVLEHGTPEQDRTYALDGKAITASDRQPIRQCPSCGAVFLSTGQAGCPQCGATLPVRPIALPQSTGQGVVEVGAVAPRAPWTVVLEAKYPGRCQRCHGSIAIGDRITWVKGERPKHAGCAPAEIRRSA